MKQRIIFILTTVVMLSLLVGCAPGRVTSAQEEDPVLPEMTELESSPGRPAPRLGDDAKPTD